MLLNTSFNENEPIAHRPAEALAGVLALLSVIRSSFQYGLFLGVIVLASVAGLRKLGYRELEVMRRGLALGLFELSVLARPFFHPFFDLTMAAAAGLTGPSS